MKRKYMRSAAVVAAVACVCMLSVSGCRKKEKEPVVQEPSVHTSRDASDTPEVTPAETENPYPEGMMES